MTNYNDGKWHGHNGGECPVHPETVGDVTYVDGTVFKDVRFGSITFNEPLLFRVIKEHKDPREVWMVEIGENITFGGNVYKQCDKSHPCAIMFREVQQ